MNQPLYSVGTYDWNEHAYTPQEGAPNSMNIPFRDLRPILHALRDMGYSAHRRGNIRDRSDDNDSNVLIERTDGKPESEILKGWKR